MLQQTPVEVFFSLTAGIGGMRTTKYGLSINMSLYAGSMQKRRPGSLEKNNTGRIIDLLMRLIP